MTSRLLHEQVAAALRNGGPKVLPLDLPPVLQGKATDLVPQGDGLPERQSPIKDVVAFGANPSRSRSLADTGGGGAGSVAVHREERWKAVAY